MHKSCLVNAKKFFETYQNDIRSTTSHVKVIEIGSQDVNGSIRPLAPLDFEYIGLDFAEAKGVDIVLKDPYSLPFEDNEIDVCLSNSCFEHSEMFWILFLEIMRVLKPTGLFYLNAPSNGAFHRYPVDCYRFYPDSGNALVTWATRNGIDACLLESFTTHKESDQLHDMWNDFIGVFLKDKKFINRYKKRIIHKLSNFDNGYTSDNSVAIINEKFLTEDLRKIFK